MSEHHHHHNINGKNLFITIILNIFITISQIIGGVLSGSLALLSDAMHNFSDVMALVIAYIANKIANNPSSASKTYGYKRAEILATLFNASVLIGIGVFLIYEAFYKFYNPEIIDSSWVIWLGLLSIVLNSVSVLLIKDDSSNNMNIKAAYLHLLTDVMTSIAVVIGGVLMYYFDIFWIDSLISVIIAIYLINVSFSLVKESSAILMQFSPSGIELDKVITLIENKDKIKNIHHIHIWKLDEHHIHLEAHLDFNEDLTLTQSNKIIDVLEKELHDNFNIEHCTFQCEYNRDDQKDKVISNEA